MFLRPQESKLAAILNDNFFIDNNSRWTNDIVCKRANAIAFETSAENATKFFYPYIQSGADRLINQIGYCLNINSGICKILDTWCPVITDIDNRNK